MKRNEIFKSFKQFKKNNVNAKTETYEEYVEKLIKIHGSIEKAVEYIAPTYHFIINNGGIVDENTKRLIESAKKR